MQQRLPAGTVLNALDENFEALLESEVDKLVRSANPRRCRRLLGLLTEFRDASQNPVLTEYYARVIGQRFLDALTER